MKLYDWELYNILQALRVYKTRKAKNLEKFYLKNPDAVLEKVEKDLLKLNLIAEKIEKELDLRKIHKRGQNDNSTTN